MILSNKNLNILIISNIFLIIISLLYFQFSYADIIFQKMFFDFDNKKWLIDKNEPVGKAVFYDLPKVILGIIIFGTLLAYYLSFKNKFPILKKYRRNIFILLLGITLIPLTVGNIKKFTNIYCPNQLKIYDGNYPYVKIFDSYPADFKQDNKGQCFPAGHAVTGFCLMILFFVFNKKSYRIASLSIAIILGWILGIYQTAKGVHFLSDTFITMLACFLVASIIARLCVYKIKDYRS